MIELISLISTQYIDSVFSHRFFWAAAEKEMRIILLIGGEHPSSQ